MSAVGGFFLFVAAGVVLIIIVSGVFALSPRARRGAIRVLGTEHGLLGRMGRFLASFTCFRRRTTMRFRELQQETSTDDRLGPLDSDDELLLGMDDAYDEP